MSTRNELIIAMQSLFAEKGQSASMSELASKVGIKTQSVYSHFENKDDILWITIKLEINTFFEKLDMAIDSATQLNSEKGLKYILDFIIDYFNSYSSLKFWRNIPLIQNVSLRLKCQNMIEEHEKLLIKKLSILFNNGLKANELKSENIEGSMILFISMIHGLLDGILLYYDRLNNAHTYIDITWNAYWNGITKA